MLRRSGGIRTDAEEITFCPTRISPPSGWRNPASSLSVVVLPQPEGPSSETNSPSPISRSRPSTAAASPNFFVSFFRATVAKLSSAAGEEVPAGEPLHGKNNQERHRKEQDAEHGDCADLSFFLEVEDDDRDDLRTRREEKNRRAELADDADEDERPRGDQPRARERHGDILQRAQAVRADDARRILELGMDRLERALGLREADRHFLREISDEENPDRTVKRQRRFRVGDEEHDAGNHERRQNEEREIARAAQQLSVRDVGEQGGQKRAGGRRNDAELEGVDDRRTRIAVFEEREREIRHCEVIERERHRPGLRKRGFQENPVRKEDRQRQNRGDQQERRPPQIAELQQPLLSAFAADGAVAPPAEQLFLHRDEADGREQQRHGERRGEIEPRGILEEGPDLRRDRVDPRRQSEDGGGAEERKRVEKRDDEAADQRGRGERQRDRERDLPLVRAEDVRRVLEVRRDELGDVGDHREDIRKAVERHHEDEPFDREDIEERAFET